MTDFDPKPILKSLSGAPGVYRMLGAKGEVLYVGKAQNLRKRVSSYFTRSAQNVRIRSMLSHVVSIEVSITHTENEALLLENNLIKSLKPRYNILLRDDKSYPYIFLSAGPFPRLAFHRGARNDKGRYFGPYPSSTSVRESLNLLQKVFPIRQCDDSFFRNRSRPCLQYQIKRCTAPCVEYISAEHYAEDVRHASLFLEGESQTVIDDMVGKMDSAASNLDYESAARYRDRIAALRQIQETQSVSGESGDADVVALAIRSGEVCVSVAFIRNGRNLGNRNFFPRIGAEQDAGSILSAFLGQYYLGKPVPVHVYLDRTFDEREWLERALSEQAGHRVALIGLPRGIRRRWVGLAKLNASDALRRHLADRASLRRRFEALQEVLGLEALPERIECFDVSHTLGEATVASCVVYTPDGPLTSEYRRFNIEGVAGGDDYAAMNQALSRRYRHVTEKSNEDDVRLPDLLLIDGGKGQLTASEAALNELGISGLCLVGVAKGEGRKPGLERLFLSGREGATILPPDSLALHLIQQIRDEAHRFAITGHRQRRSKARTASVLEDIQGIGEKRRQALLKRLGGLQEVARAGVQDLERVPGISPALARRIYALFHDGEC